MRFLLLGTGLRTELGVASLTGVPTSVLTAALGIGPNASASPRQGRWDKMYSNPSAHRSVEVRICQHRTARISTT